MAALFLTPMAHLRISGKGQCPLMFNWQCPTASTCMATDLAHVKVLDCGCQPLFWVNHHRTANFSGHLICL